MEDIKALYDEKVKQEVEERPRRWRANGDEVYFYVDSYGEIFDETDFCNNEDNYRYKIGNYFQTKKQAEEYNKKILLQQAYKDWCRFDIDWEDEGQEKSYAYYNTIDKEISVAVIHIFKIQGITYAESKARIREFIDKIGEEDFKKYILEVE